MSARGRQLAPIELLALCIIDEKRNDARFAPVDLEAAMKPHPVADALELLQQSGLIRPKQTIGNKTIAGTLAVTTDGRIHAGRDFDAVLADLESRALECQGRSEDYKGKNRNIDAAEFAKLAKFWIAIRVRLAPYRDRLYAFHQRAAQEVVESEDTPAIETDPLPAAKAAAPTPPPDPRLSKRAKAAEPAAKE